MMCDCNLRFTDSFSTKEIEKFIKYFDITQAYFFFSSQGSVYSRSRIIWLIPFSSVVLFKKLVYSRGRIYRVRMVYQEIMCKEVMHTYFELIRSFHISGNYLRRLLYWNPWIISVLHLKQFWRLDDDQIKNQYVGN